MYGRVPVVGVTPLAIELAFLGRDSSVHRGARHLELKALFVELSHNCARTNRAHQAFGLMRGLSQESQLDRLWLSPSSWLASDH